eukprot:scaffold263416_cov32-Prasinocladus_malaysianus.AAC.1
MASMCTHTCPSLWLAQIAINFAFIWADLRDRHVGGHAFAPMAQWACIAEPDADLSARMMHGSFVLSVVIID